ncbi:chemotaxis protein CheB [Pedosphaera parvula]|uniref:protein-glutamate methylesterase n=1 Tax=Pedosphaera parvula (strain Ellin514) TaxID=320771 RepID=B9XF24_PEDPL|nr:chemotaxis protein CheB [Pedosphaera parvula]EEF61522.1 CheB methylesterase [Pedosphaera parvula Ellin514]
MSNFKSRPAQWVVTIAASAGGLHGLSHILDSLPEDFPAAIAVVMHLSPHFTSKLAEILNQRSLLDVKWAAEGDLMQCSTVYVAPPDWHVRVCESGTLNLFKGKKIRFTRPAAEPLFMSAAEVYKERVIGVVLSGSDSDGATGVQAIKAHGGRVITQDKATSLHFSMPKSAIHTGAVDFVLPITEIAPRLMTLVPGKDASREINELIC